MNRAPLRQYDRITVRREGREPVQFFPLRDRPIRWAERSRSDDCASILQRPVWKAQFHVQIASYPLRRGLRNCCQRSVFLRFSVFYRATER